MDKRNTENSSPVTDTCPKCKGAKQIEYEITNHGERNERVMDKCNLCGGTGTKPLSPVTELLGNTLDAAERLAIGLTCSVHKVVTEVDGSVPCPENERVLYAVQLTQPDIDLIVAALRRHAQTQQEPVAWRCKDYAGEWIYIDDKVSAEDYRRDTGCLMQPLYLRAQTPLDPTAKGPEDCAEYMLLQARKKGSHDQWTNIYAAQLEQFIGYGCEVRALSVTSTDGLPPLDDGLHTPELIAELQKPAMLTRDSLKEVLRCHEWKHAYIYGKHDLIDAIIAATEPKR